MFINLHAAQKSGKQNNNYNLLKFKKMISAKTIKSLDFSTKDEYFNYVIDSYLNGQFTQLKSLIKKMSKSDKIEFKDYLHESAESFNTKMKITEYLIN